MESDNLRKAPRDLGRVNEARLSKLRRVLRETPGFALVVVTVEAGPLREEVVRRLAVWSGRDGVPSLEMILVTQPESLTSLSASGGLVLIEPEDALPAAKIQLVQWLNWQRDGLRNAVSGPLVLVLGKVGHQALFEQAPDLYSWRRHSAAISPPLSHIHVPNLLRRDGSRHEERLRLQSTLEELRAKRALPAFAEAALRRRIADLLIQEGLYLEAEALSRESLSIFHNEADALGELSVVLTLAEAAWGRAAHAQAASLLDRAILLRGSLGTAHEFAESLARVGAGEAQTSLRIAVLFASLTIERDPMQVLMELRRVDLDACSKRDKAVVLFLRAAALQRLGEVDDAADQLELAKELYEELDVTFQLVLLTALSQLQISRGSLQEALQSIGRIKDGLSSALPASETTKLIHEQLDHALASLRRSSVERADAQEYAAGVSEEETYEAAIQRLLREEAFFEVSSDSNVRSFRLGVIAKRAQLEFVRGHLAAAATIASSLEEMASSPPLHQVRAGNRLLLAALAPQMEDAESLIRGAEEDLILSGDRVVLARVWLILARLLLTLRVSGEPTEKLDLAERAFHDLGDLAGLEQVAEIRVQLEHLSATDR